LKRHMDKYEIARRKSARLLYLRSLHYLSEGQAPIPALNRAIRELTCPKCLGFGKFDDADLGDTACNEYHCTICNRTGVKQDDVKI